MVGGVDGSDVPEGAEPGGGIGCPVEFAPGGGVDADGNVVRSAVGVVFGVVPGRLLSRFGLTVGAGVAGATGAGRS